MNKPESNRLKWSKINVPPELSDLIMMVGKAKGYPREDIHRFLYHLLKTAYPEDVEKLRDYLGAHYLEED